MSVPALVWIDSIYVGNTVAKALLRYLATHNFLKPGFFFKNSTYMAALEISEKTLQRSFAHLEKNNFITIERRFDDNGRQLSNGIYLNIPQDFIDSYEERIKEGVKLSVPLPPPVKVTTLGSSDCRLPPRQSDDPYNNNKNNYKINREREPLCSIFVQNEENTILAKDLKLNLAEELDSFNHRHKGDKNQYEFTRWLKNSYKYAQKKVNATKENSYKQEVKCTVPEYERDKPILRASKEVVTKNMDKIKQLLSRKIVNGQSRSESIDGQETRTR